MDIATGIYNDIIKKLGFLFRGVSLGTNMGDVEKIEGDDYYEVLGSLPHHEYFFETGEWEEITIYYGFKEVQNTVNSIDLYLYAYPKIYWENSGGKDIANFFNLIQQGNLDPYSKHFNEVKDKVIQNFKSQLGEPIIKETSEVFDQPYHKFRKYIWKSDDGNSLSVTEYIDDLKNDSVKNVLHLFLVKDQ